MVTARLLRVVSVTARAGYHAIGACAIYSVAVTAVTTAAQEGLTWLGLHVVVMGWIFGIVGRHVTSKGVELSCGLYYATSFWSWILSWKYPHFVEISTFRRYYPHFVEISMFREY